jgi:hypothetical protein
MLSAGSKDSYSAEEFSSLQPHEGVRETIKSA